MCWGRDGSESCLGAGVFVSVSRAVLGWGSFWIWLSQWEGLCSSCGGAAGAVGVFSSLQIKTGS